MAKTQNYIVAIGVVVIWWAWSQLNAMTITSSSWTIGTLTLSADFVNWLALILAIGLSGYLAALAAKKIFKRK